MKDECEWRKMNVANKWEDETHQVLFLFIIHPSSFIILHFAPLRQRFGIDARRIGGRQGGLPVEEAAGGHGILVVSGIFGEFEAAANQPGDRQRGVVQRLPASGRRFPGADRGFGFDERTRARSSGYSAARRRGGSTPSKASSGTSFRGEKTQFSASTAISPGGFSEVEKRQFNSGPVLCIVSRAKCSEIGSSSSG